MDGMTSPLPVEPAGASPSPAAQISHAVDPKPDEGSTAGESVVDRALKRWDYALSVESKNRESEAEDLRFAWVRGAQWDEAIRRKRDAAKRPWLEFNQTRQFIKKVVNNIRQSRPAIEVRPAGGGATPEMAQIRSALIRHIEYDSNAEQAYAVAVELAATGGRGYLRVYTEYVSETSVDQKLKIASIPNPMSALMDPDAQAPDKSDAKYCFVTEWLDQETYEREWGEENAAALSWDDSVRGDEYAQWWQGDKVCVCDYFEVVEDTVALLILPNGQGVWADSPAIQQAKAAGVPVMTLRTEQRKRKRVDWYKLSANPEPLAKYEWRGKYIPVVMIVGDQMDVDGSRMYKGVVRDLRDAQMFYNYSFTAAAERIALTSKAPWVGLAGQFENHPEWDTANTENHSKLEYESIVLEDGQTFTTPPQRTAGPEIPQAFLAMCQQSADLLRQITGMKEASLSEATQPQEPGIALLARREDGDTITFNFPDNARMAIALVGKICNDAIPFVYDAARTIPQLDIDGTQKQVQVNQPAPAMDQSGMVTGMQTVNDLTVGEYDIVTDVGPAYATRRLQAANEIVEFMTGLDPEQKALMTDLAAKSMDWPDKTGDQIAARLFMSLPPNIQAMDPSDDPQVAALKAALQQQQQTSQQQLQAAQGQLAQAGQQIQKLQSQVYQAQAATAGARLDGKRKDAEASADVTTQMLETQDVQAKIASEQRKTDSKLQNDAEERAIKRAQLDVQVFEALTALIGKLGPVLGQQGAQIADVEQRPAEMATGIGD